MTRPVDVSVIVVSHRPGSWLAPCLESVGAHDVILVDNGSPDQTASAIARSCGARVVRLSRNAGFPAGVNAGLALADRELVALLNDDAVAEPGWIESALPVLADPSVASVAPKLLLHPTFARIEPAASPDRPADEPGMVIRSVTVAGREVLEAVVGGIGPIEQGPSGERCRRIRGVDPFHVPLPDGVDLDGVRVNGMPLAEFAAEGTVTVGDVINNAGSYLSRRGYGGDYGYETADVGQFDQPAERFGSSGAALVARRDTFRRVGPLAGGFFAYYEDLDWNWRARLCGFGHRVEPSGVVRHVRSATSAATDRYLVDLLGERNRLLCLARNAPIKAAVEETRLALRNPSHPATPRSWMAHVGPEVLSRLRWSRSWKRSPDEVWREWAGRDESWGLSSQGPQA